MEYEDRRTIATPEGVQLALPLAGIATRFMALMLDLLIGFGVAFILLMAAAVVANAIAAIVAASLLLVFYIGYHVLFEVAGGGRTVGKRAAGLRVVMDGGAPVGLRASLIRNLMRLIEGLPLFYMPAIITALSTRDNQRLGDLAAGTLVVREMKAPTTAALLPGRRRSRPSTTRAGTSRRSATTSRPPSAPSWSGAANSTRARAPRSPRSWRAACARWWPACVPA